MTIDMTNNIEQIALEVSQEIYGSQATGQEVEFLRRFLAKIGAGLEPVAERVRHGVLRFMSGYHSLPEGTKLYATHAEAILSAEQRVAEACAKYVAQSNSPEHRVELAQGIRSGAWREYQ